MLLSALYVGTGIDNTCLWIRRVRTLQHVSIVPVYNRIIFYRVGVVLTEVI